MPQAAAISPVPRAELPTIRQRPSPARGQARRSDVEIRSETQRLHLSADGRTHSATREQPQSLRPTTAPGSALGWASSCASQQQRDSLYGPKGPERPDRVSGQSFRPSRPAHFEYAKRAFQRQYQADEAELAEFDADVEADECQRQLMTRQAGAGESAGEAESVQQAECERHYPRMANREARLAAPEAHNFRPQE